MKKILLFLLVHICLIGDTLAAKLEKTNDFASDLKELLEYPGPTLIDIVVTEDENCYPMVAPGKSNSQMIGVFKRDLKEANYLNS